MQIDVAELKANGFELMPESDPRRFGYPADVDIWECLWFEIVASLKNGIDWRLNQVRSEIAAS